MYVLLRRSQTTFEEESGHQHVYLHRPPVPGFFGLHWQGFYFTFCTLLFHWKPSAFLYHNLGLVTSGVTPFVRCSTIPVH